MAAARPHQKPDREHRRSLQKLRGLIALGKERWCKIERREGVGIEIEPLDEVAGRARENSPNSSAAIRAIIQRRCAEGHRLAGHRYSSPQRSFIRFLEQQPRTNCAAMVYRSSAASASAFPLSPASARSKQPMAIEFGPRETSTGYTIRRHFEANKHRPSCCSAIAPR